MDDVDPRFMRHLGEHGLVAWEHELAIDVLGHGLTAGIARDRVEDSRRARADRPLAEIHQRLGDAVESGPHQVRMLAQLAYHSRLVLADQVAGDRQRAEDSLDHWYAEAELLGDQVQRFDLIVERLAVHKRNRAPRFEVRDAFALQDRSFETMPRRLVHRTECLRKARCTRLELHEIQPKEVGGPAGDRGEIRWRPPLAIGVPPRPERRPVRHSHGDRRFDPLSAIHEIEFKLDHMSDIEAQAAGLRAAAEARPMRLPVNRRVDERHHVVTNDGLSVWYTIQVSPHSRIQEVIFERSDRMPSDEECERWLRLLVVGAEATEAPGLPGAMTRRFEAFERSPEHEAPLA